MHQLRMYGALTKFARFALKHNAKNKMPSRSMILTIPLCLLLLHSVKHGMSDKVKVEASKTVDEVKRSQ